MNGGGENFERLLRAAREVRARLLFLPLVAVGGTAAAIYARHRVSQDVDFVSQFLRARFDEITAALEEMPAFEIVRTRRPVLILGRVGEDEIGLRQLRRETPMEVVEHAGLCVPTLPELLRIKCHLLGERRAVRDFVDVAALAETAGMEAAVAALAPLDALYSGLTAAGPLIAFAEAAHDDPVDATLVDLRAWRTLRPEYHDFARVQGICRELALRAIEQADHGAT